MRKRDVCFCLHMPYILTTSNHSIETTLYCLGLSFCYFAAKTSVGGSSAVKHIFCHISTAEDHKHIRKPWRTHIRFSLLFPLQIQLIRVR